MNNLSPDEQDIFDLLYRELENYLSDYANHAPDHYIYKWELSADPMSVIEARIRNEDYKEVQLFGIDYEVVCGTITESGGRQYLAFIDDGNNRKLLYAIPT